MRKEQLRSFCVGLLLFLCLSVLSFNGVSCEELPSDDINELDTGSKSTTSTTAEDEQRAMRRAIDEELASLRKNGEQFQFQAEVSRVLDILIHSLYSNRDVFLRELVSNASDALDKIRFLALTDATALRARPELEIKISLDDDRRTITIEDSGIGMTRDELAANLGTIAKSGTKEFLDKLAEARESNLIGQFGVGFYSAFLVADTVKVQSKSNNDTTQWVWTSREGEGFVITPDPEGNSLGRGTRITLFLKSDRDTSGYLSYERLAAILRNYSQFISFPIFLYRPRVEETELGFEDEYQQPDPDAAGPQLDLEEVEELVEVEIKREVIWEWKQINDVTPIWLRPRADVSDAEYHRFYNALIDEDRDALKKKGLYNEDDSKPPVYDHFRAEGEVEFNALLFVPRKSTSSAEASTAGKGLRLFVRRVFITDDWETLMPRYLDFLRGVVDSDDLPLNVSRENLQKHRVLELIKKKVVRKIVSLLTALSEEDVESKESGSDEETTYDLFWSQYANNVKLGVIEDLINRVRLSKLLRFRSNKVEGLTTLDGYVSRMKEGQRQMYYLAGSNEHELRTSPLVERIEEEGYEVLYALSPIDEYMFQALQRYDNEHWLTNAGKEGVFFDFKEKKAEPGSADQLLLDYLSAQLKGRITKAKLSKRLVSSPCALIGTHAGYSPMQERLIHAQTLTGQQAPEMSNQRVLEVNTRHPLVRELRRLVTLENSNLENSNLENSNLEKSEVEMMKEDLAEMLYETSVVSSGFHLTEPKKFVERVHRLVGKGLNVSDMTLEEEEGDDDDEGGDMGGEDDAEDV